MAARKDSLPSQEGDLDPFAIEDLDPLGDPAMDDLAVDDLAVDDLKTPILLLAMPQILDPFFQMSVVLLIRHDADGSLGFIINRPTAVPVGEIMNGLDIDWTGDPVQAAHFGGPVRPQLGTVLYRSKRPIDSDTGVEILPDVWMTQNIQDLIELGEDPPVDLRLFLGHSGWGEGQLMGEIQRNDWLTAPVSLDLVFTTESEKVWSTALESVGLHPSQLPSWTPSGDDLPAN